jgi:hypothetical protein
VARTAQNTAPVSPAEPFLAAFKDLDKTQSAIGEDFKAREGKVTASQQADKAVRKIADELLTDISKAQNPKAYERAVNAANSEFKGKLDSTIKALQPADKPQADKPQADKPPFHTIDDAKAQLDRIKFMASSQIYVILPSPQRAWVETELNQHTHNQSLLESRATKAAEGESAAAATLTLFEAVQREGGHEWFEYSKTFSESENRKASVTVKLEDRGSPGAAKSDVVAFDATWKKPVPVSLSLGFAVTSLARTDFSVTTAPGVSGATPTYQLSATSTHPIAFPLVLLHYDIPHALPATHWGFSFSGGAGADVSGSTPTGEFAGGGSLRYRSIYLSGLLHFGRRKALQSGHALGDTVPAGSTPPTQDVWGKGFAFAIAYRAPL